MNLLSDWQILLVCLIIAILACGAFFSTQLEEWLIKKSHKVVMYQLYQTYLCGHNLFAMIRVNFFQRFGNLNHEGFCYTFSAAIMLGLKAMKHTRVVRGHIVLPDYDSFHSWVEVKVFGIWYVVDPCFISRGIIRRSWYYQENHPKILVIYPYKKFWSDPAALQFYERLKRPELSKVFTELYYHYTPKGEAIEIPNMKDDEYDFLDKSQYYLFPPVYGFKFDQEIVNELMARPTRKSPRRRTLRRLDSYYRRRVRELAQKSPA